MSSTYARKKMEEPRDEATFSECRSAISFLISRTSMPHINSVKSCDHERITESYCTQQDLVTEQLVVHADTRPSFLFDWLRSVVGGDHSRWGTVRYLMRDLICLSESLILFGMLWGQGLGLTVCFRWQCGYMCYDSSVHITDQWMLRLDWYWGPYLNMDVGSSGDGGESG